MQYEGDESAKSVLDWLDEGGYSCVLFFDGKQHAYVVDEDDDYGWQRVPVSAARELLDTTRIAVWREHGDYNAYRPTAWVEEWQRQYPDKVPAGTPAEVRHCRSCGLVLPTEPTLSDHYQESERLPGGGSRISKFGVVEKRRCQCGMWDRRFVELPRPTVKE